jgi:hypothetical protein
VTQNWKHAPTNPAARDLSGVQEAVAPAVSGDADATIVSDSLEPLPAECAAPASTPFSAALPSSQPILPL